MKALVLCLTLLTLALPAEAQQRLESDPGYFDLSEVDDFMASDATLEVNVKGALLRMVAQASRVEDEDLANLLFRLKAIQVRGYTLGESEARSIRGQVRDMSNRLRDRGWDPVVRVRQEGEEVEMLVLEPAGSIQGMVVFVIHPGENETVFVNIVGEINPEEIARIGQRFHIDVLDF